jgi:gamma-glutamylcysteine synthetase
MVGLECELPIVDTTGAAIGHPVVRTLFDHLGRYGFVLERDSFTGEVVAAARVAGSSTEASDGSRYDVVQLELGYCTVELSIAPEPTLFAAERRLQDLLALVVRHLAPKGCRPLGLGMQPLTRPSRKLQAPKSRFLLYERDSSHRVLDPVLGADVHLFTVTAANQCHIDVHAAEAARALNVVNGLCGAQLALTANSSVWKGAVDEQRKAPRELFYDIVYGAQTPSSIGIPPRFHRLEGYLGHLYRTPAAMVERAGASLELVGRPTVGDFLDSDAEFAGQLPDGSPVSVTPRPEDVLRFAKFLEFNARLSPVYGTLESRISCQQPPGETLVVPALVLGMLENLDEAERLLAPLSLAQSRALRANAIAHALDARVGGLAVSDLAAQLLVVARAGLRRRGCGEEVFLEPLERRCARRVAPADEAAAAFRALGLPGLVDGWAFRAPAAR